MVDSIKRCRICNKILVNVNGELYLHPSDKCQEKDGFEIRVIDDFLAKQWEIKYGVPEYNPADYVRLIEVYRRLEKLMFWKRYRKKTKV